MKQVYLVLGVIAAVLLLGGCWIIGQRNALISLNQDVNKAWSDINADLTRRAELIPNLFETVKGYSIHENTVFTNIADARSKLAGAQTPADRIAANDELSGCLSRLLVVVEQYPELKADKEFTRLMDELSGTENRIKVARVRYNEIVKKYNTEILKFPGSLFAGSLGFKERPYFEPPQGTQVDNAPKISFNNDANNNGNNANNNGGNNNGGNASNAN